MYAFDEIKKADSEIADAIQAEMKRQNSHLELIASENWVSPAVMSAMGSVLTNKYAEGYPGRRYYGGCQWVDAVEELARERACALFGAEHANVQPHSGAQANLAAYFSLLQTLGPELYILREAPLQDIQQAAGPLLAEGVRRLRAGLVQRTGGYDGQYG